MQDNTFLKISSNKVNIFYKTQIIKDLQTQNYTNKEILFVTNSFIRTKFAVVGICSLRKYCIWLKHALKQRN